MGRAGRALLYTKNQVRDPIILSVLLHPANIMVWVYVWGKYGTQKPADPCARCELGECAVGRRARCLPRGQGWVGCALRSDCSNVSGTRGSRKDERKRWRVLTQIVLSRRVRLR